MTSTENRKTVRKTTSYARDRGRSRPVVVTLENDYVHVRLAGCRATYSMTASALYSLAVYNHVLAVKAARKAQREAKRKEKRR